MSSKDLKINIITDASGVATLSKGVAEVEKQVTKTTTSTENLSKQLEIAKAKVESFASKSASAYTDLLNKLNTYNDRIVKNGKNEAFVWGSAQASVAKYNNELQKAIDNYSNLKAKILEVQTAQPTAFMGLTTTLGKQIAADTKLRDQDLKQLEVDILKRKDLLKQYMQGNASVMSSGTVPFLELSKMIQGMSGSGSMAALGAGNIATAVLNKEKQLKAETALVTKELAFTEEVERRQALRRNAFEASQNAARLASINAFVVERAATMAREETALNAHIGREVAAYKKLKQAESDARVSSFTTGAGIMANGSVNAPIVRKQPDLIGGMTQAGKLAGEAREIQLLNQALTQENALRERLAVSAKAYLARAAEVNALAEKNKAHNEQIASSYQDIINRLTMTARAYEATKLAAQGFSQAQIQNIQRLQANSTALQEHEHHTRNLFLRVGEAIGAYRIWNTLLNTITSAPRTLTNVGIELEATQSILQSTMGSAAGAAGAMKFLDKEAQRTGITISTLRTSWRDFSASTTLAGMSLNSTAKMFGNLNTVITALHLTSDRAQGVFNAMAQIFNKSKVQSEELVKQLGNLLPGAFAMFAASVHNANGTIGISTQELAQQMRKGVVFAKDTMEDFAGAFADAFKGSFALASQGMNATIGRMSTSLTHLGEAFYGLSSGPILETVKGVTSLTDTLTKAVKASGEVGVHFTGLKSIFEGIFVGGIALALVNIRKLDFALKLLSFSNVFTASLTVLASTLAYLYNKNQEASSQLVLAQEQMLAKQQEFAATDTEMKIEIRVENAPAIVTATKELEALRQESVAYAATVADTLDRLGSRTTAYEEEKAAAEKQKQQYKELIAWKTNALTEAKKAEQVLIEQADKEAADRQQKLLEPSGHNQTVKEHLTAQKKYFQDRLDNIDYYGKLEQLASANVIAGLNHLYAMGEISEIAHIEAVKLARREALTEQQKQLQEKIDLTSQEIASLASKQTFSSTAIDSADLETLKAYTKALETKNVTEKDGMVNFSTLIEGKERFVSLSKEGIKELEAQIAAQDRATASGNLATEVPYTMAKGTSEASKATERLYELQKVLRDLMVEMGQVSLSASQQEMQAQEQLKAALETKADLIRGINSQYETLLGNARRVQDLADEAAYKDIKNKLAGGVASKDPEAITADKLNNSNYQYLKNQTTEARKATDAMHKYVGALRDASKESDKLKISSDGVFGNSISGVQTLSNAFINLTNIVTEYGEKSKDLNKQQLASAEEYDARLRLITKNVHNGAITEQQANRQRDVIQKAYTKDVLLFDKERSKQDRVALQQGLQSASALAGAASKMFKEKSAAAKAFHAIEVGLSIASMAMKAAEMAMELKSTIVSVVAGAAKFFAQSGWVGFAGVAAMLAVLGGLGYAASAASVPDMAEPPKMSPDSGTVLGDATAKSESINNTYELLQDIHAKEYASLRSIDQGISNLHTGITDTITRIFQAGGVKDFASLDKTKLTGIGTYNLSTSIDPFQKLLTSLFFGGKRSQKVTQSGIQLDATALSDVLDGKGVSARAFNTIETTIKGGWFTKKHVYYDKKFAELDAQTNKALTDIIKNMGVTLLGVADQLGLGLSEQVKAYVIPAITVDLLGLTGEDAAKKLNNVLSTALDTMSNDLFGKILTEYQQLGEGMLETAIRVVAQMTVVKDTLATSGITFSGDLIKLSDTLVKAAGGLKAFKEQFESYYDKFYSDEEKQLRLKEKLTVQLAGTDLVLASSREGYRKQLEAVDLNTKAGQKQYSTLLQLSEAADTYYTEVEKGLANLATGLANLFKISLKNQTPEQKQADLGSGLYTTLVQTISDADIAAIAPSREALGSYLSALDKSSEAYPKIITALASVSTELDSWYTGVEDVATKAAELAKTKHKLDLDLMTAQGKTLDVLAQNRRDELAAMDKTLAVLKAQIFAQTDLAAAMKVNASLNIQLLTAQGDTGAVTAATRTGVLDGFIAQIAAARKDLADWTITNSNILVSPEGNPGITNQNILDNVAEHHLDTVKKILDAAIQLGVSFEQVGAAFGLTAQQTEKAITDAGITVVSAADKATADAAGSAFLANVVALTDNLGLQTQINEVTDNQNNYKAAIAGTIAVLNIQGKASEALNYQRGEELRLLRLSGDVQGLQNAQQRIYAEDKAKTDSLQLELLNALGLSTKALAVTRQNELKALSETDQAIKLQVYAAQDAIKAVAEAFEVLQKSVEAEKTKLTASYDASTKGAQQSIDDLTKSTEKLKSLAQALKGFLNSFVVKGNESFDRRNAQKQLSTALATARLEGAAGIVDSEKLTQAISTLSKPSEDLFSTFEDYQRDFIVTANDIAQLAYLTDASLSVADKQLKVLQDTLMLTKQKYDAEIAQYDDILATAQLQLNAVNGTTVAVISVRDAIINLNTAIARQYATKATVTGAGGAGSAVVYGNTLPSFAIGINHVPHDMTANIHKGERILPAADNAELMMRLSDLRTGSKDTAISQELLSEVRALRKTTEEQSKLLEEQTKVISDQSRQLLEIQKATKSTAGTLDDAAGGRPLHIKAT